MKKKKIVRTATAEELKATCKPSGASIYRLSGADQELLEKRQFSAIHTLKVFSVPAAQLQERSAGEIEFALHWQGPALD